MRQLRYLIVAAVAMTLPSCDRAESTDPAPAAAPPPAPAAASAPSTGTPRIRFVKTAHDFGVVADSRDYYTRFRFTNTGTGTLVISDVKATCGCTVPSLAKTEFAPGESAAIEVSFDPSGRAGRQNQTVSVISNAGPGGPAKLVIQADVRPLVHFSFFLRFGDVELGRQHARDAELTYTDPDLQITDVFVTNPHVTAEVVEMGEPNPVAGGLPYRGKMRVTIASDAPWGLLRSTQVKFTARGRAAEQFPPGVATYTMWVNAQLFRDVRAEPLMLASRQSIGRGQPFKLAVDLSRISGAPFAVTGIEITKTTTEGFEPSFVENEAGGYTVYLEGTTPSGGGTLNGDVTVTTDVPGEERLTIPFAMYVK